MKKLLLLAALVMGVVACNNATLQSGGVYTDKVLYNADTVITTSYQVIDAFLSWESQNHAALITSGSKIPAFADDLRKNAPQWFKSAEALRAAYAAAPTASNASQLATALSLLQTAIGQAAAYITPPTPTS